ncbi:hypothetical protein [Burkholderia anthina]|uniref:hypothetical protein n=1 Tax=Burkholderia anthina TaxID=179879 RepID=UPI0012DAC949|nr:hypothetical protein [Burkholderia anthina]
MPNRLMVAGSMREHAWTDIGVTISAVSASMLARRDGPDTIACDGPIHCFVAVVRRHDGAKPPENTLSQ